MAQHAETISCNGIDARGGTAELQQETKRDQDSKRKDIAGAGQCTA
jgi:hypothetical protein